MEFLVEFDVHVPVEASESEVNRREDAEASAAGKLLDEGHLVRLWSPIPMIRQPSSTFSVPERTQP